MHSVAMIGFRPSANSHITARKALIASGSASGQQGMPPKGVSQEVLTYGCTLMT
jgi:hypothetical protein